MPEKILFFGPLKRRADYETKSNGGNYYYSRQRIAIAEDCDRRCVYCDSHEDEVGGHESMETDHFRPYRRADSGGQRDDPTNLVHSCGTCNGFKSDHWPTGDPKLSYNDKEGWVEPFEECRADFFEVETNGSLRARKAPAEYIIKLLRLNRELLRRLRERRQLLADLPNLLVRLEAKWQPIADGREPGDAKAIARDGVRLIALIKALQKTGLT